MEYCFPESIYEGYSPIEEDKGFDKEVFDTPAYIRAAIRIMRQNSLISGSTSVTAVASQYSRPQRQPTIDFLSDQLPEEQSSQTTDAGLLNGDGIGDLINLVDDTIIWTESPSAQFKCLEGLYWEAPMDSVTPDPLNEDPLKATTIRGETATEMAIGNDTDSVRPLNVALNSLTAQESKSAIIEHGSSRDSGYASTTQSSGTKNGSAGHLDDPVPISKPEEKIPVWTEEQNNDSSATSTAMSRNDSISTNQSGIATHMSSTNGDVLTPLSPSLSSPFSERPLPADHRLSNTSAFVPPSDQDAGQSLFDTMATTTASSDPVALLDWAENVLQHCTISTAHEIRLTKMNPKSKSGKPLVSEREIDMMETAIQIIKDLQQARSGRAYFLGARYIESGEEKEALHLLAYRNRYPRSLFYLGNMSEKRTLVEEAKKRYHDASIDEDAACLLVSLSLRGKFR